MHPRTKERTKSNQRPAPRNNVEIEGLINLSVTSLSIFRIFVKFMTKKRMSKIYSLVKSVVLKHRMFTAMQKPGVNKTYMIQLPTNGLV